MSAVTKLMTPGGGGVALTPASSIAADVTVSVPSQNCTLGIQGPAFSAYKSGSSQSVSTGTFTKITFESEEFDTNDNFASSRFTPTVAGYYQINWLVNLASGSGSYEVVSSLYKNGTAYKTGLDTNSSQYGLGGSVLCYLNGSTDYVEIYLYQGSGSSINVPAYQTGTYMQGCLVRAA